MIPDKMVEVVRVNVYGHNDEKTIRVALDEAGVGELIETLKPENYCYHSARVLLEKLGVKL